MAKVPKSSIGSSGGKKKNETIGKRTSIGKSLNTRPKNKNKRRNWKAYRGQGK